jgi:hypothetical protein
MRYVTKGLCLIEPIIHACYIGAQLETHLAQFNLKYFDGWYEALYNRKGFPLKPKAPWHEYNVRAGSIKVVPGVLSELISTIVIQELYDTPIDIKIIQDKDLQLGGIDLIDYTNNISYQVKTVIQNQSDVSVYEHKDIMHPKADRIVLVDIDKNLIYIIPSSELKRYIQPSENFSRTLGPQAGGHIGWNCFSNALQNMSLNSNISTTHLYDKHVFQLAEITLLKNEI